MNDRETRVRDAIRRAVPANRRVLVRTYREVLHSPIAGRVRREVKVALLVNLFQAEPEGE